MRRRLSVAAVGTALLMSATACAGSVGSQGGSAANAEGYEFGAGQADIESALADLDPVTLTYQSAASSPAGIQAKDKVWAESIEERSGGKITVDVVYGQAIAGFDEIHEALADGRLDMAYTLPAYDPSRFPLFDDLSVGLSVLPSSPMVGELVANAVGAELSWGSEEFIEEFEGQGLYPLFPLLASANLYPQCTDPGADLADWEGRQIRAGASAHQAMADSLGAQAVSLSFTEVYEALQRRTVDCALNSMNSAADYGFIDVANNISYATQTTIPRGPGAMLAGSKVANLPLPYRQVLFDSLVEAFVGGVEVAIDGNYEGVQEVRETGGSISAFGPDAEERLVQANERLLADVEAEGALSESLGDDVSTAGEKWFAKAAELGYADQGSLADMDQWYDPETDFTAFAEAVYEDILLEHRPA